MKKIKVYFVCLIGLLFTGNLFAQAPSVFADIDIPYQRFVLDNGLTVIIHEDHKAPVVAVNIWYHVGSKNEKPGKTGFAHLFEHLMFNGSEHFNDDYFKALDKIGASDLNGTTSNDRTNYFETVPISALDQVLWLESDRMGYMVNAITQAKLDEQRGVVQNEKRQYENEPFGLVDEYMTKSVYPATHPYSWTVIGSMEDLNAASLDDVKEWFKTYYGPNNAVLALAGDINTNEALEKVKKYFGGLQAGPPVVKYNQWPAKRTGVQRQIMQDRVPQQRIYKVWNVPQDGSWEYKMLDLASDVLAVGKNSRLYKRLVYNDQIATSVYCYLDNREIGSLFTIEADVKPGVELSVVEKAIDEEMAKFLQSGPTEEELARVKTAGYASFVRGLERVGGFGGKSDILASNQTFFGSPDYYKTIIKYLREAKAADILNVSKQWLSDGQYVLEVHPFTEPKVAQADADRSKMPEMGAAPDITMPKFQREKLSNGLTIVLAQRKSIPVVNLALAFNAGYATDINSIPGTAKLAMNMLDEGTKTRNSLKINEEITNLGSQLSTGSNLDQSFVILNTLKANLKPSLEIFADVVLNPSFPQADLDRLKKEQLVAIQREKVQPNSTALRILPKYLYGDKHPYGLPFTGSGFESTINNITRESIVKFQQSWLVPNNATLIVVGDITMEEIKPQIEALFKTWKPGNVEKLPIATVNMPSKPIIYLMDRPGSIQSIVFAGNLSARYGELDEPTVSVMNSIIGGEFTSRINMNIREDKHWSYGAGSFLRDTRGQRPFIAYTQVQSDKTKETVQEIYKELSQYLGDKPATSEEVSKNQSNQFLQFTGKYETMSAVLWDINDILKYNLPDNYFQTYANKLKALQVKDVQSVAKQVIKSDQLVWVVVGDKSKIEAPLKEIGYEIKMIDADGNLLK
ncbi:MAG TPA: pitrilysin family protein [Bacteroidales bacterium]|nr:pitrilysin family protein [Bacteroidales bacterium]